MTSENHSTLASSEHATTITLSPDDPLANASGPVVIPMTNDYLFKTFLQHNQKALKGLIAALLHMSPEEIRSVEITNPLEPGDYVTEKTLMLDVKVCFNNNTLINLEMQVINEHNWTDRSLTYLCRTFDQLKSGEEYSSAKPAIQIGFLDFTLFPDVPEFYATFKMMNVKNHMVYSDKFVLCVINLTCINLATEEDKFYQIDRWASLFKATTWEEIHMLAAQNEYIKEASNTIYQISAEERIRQQCEAREDFLRREKEKERRFREAEENLAKAEAELARLKALVAQLQAELDAKQTP